MLSFCQHIMAVIHADKRTKIISYYAAPSRINVYRHMSITFCFNQVFCTLRLVYNSYPEIEHLITLLKWSCIQSGLFLIYTSKHISFTWTWFYFTVKFLHKYLNSFWRNTLKQIHFMSKVDWSWKQSQFT